MGVERDLIDRLRAAAEELEARYTDELLEDADTDGELRTWLDGNDDTPLPWTHPDLVTADEWFFITTLYGEMTLDGQRTHIRKYYPSLFEAAHRDMRDFLPDMPEYRGLRSRWMSTRLAKMGEILRSRSISMDKYSDHLRVIETTATPDNPIPALDTIIRDHRATGWKTLSVFVRDYIRGNSFPIDSRVEKELRRHSLPADGRLLVSLSLAIGRNPRKLARGFYMAGGTT